jgi:hypothetical protein
MSAGLLPLSSDELATKADLVAVVDRTIASFIECGTAELSADDRRLAAVGHVAYWLDDNRPPSLLFPVVQTLHNGKSPRSAPSHRAVKR